MHHASVSRVALCAIVLSGIPIARAAVTCSYAVSPASLTVPISGTAGSLTITASDPTCSWSAVSTKPWINLTTNPSGIGSGMVSYTINPNTTSAPLMGGIVIGGANVIVQVIVDPKNPTPLYADTPPSYGFFDWVQLMGSLGITKGCATNPANFCPDTPATRGQMAVFLVRAIIGDQFTFQQQQPYFTDVPASNSFFPYIQKLKELNLALECAPAKFCPDDTLTRGDAARMIINSKFGPNLPYPPAPYFTDVASTDPLFPYAQLFRQEGYTVGCGGTQFCPSSPATRGMVSVFVIRAFFSN